MKIVKLSLLMILSLVFLQAVTMTMIQIKWKSLTEFGMLKILAEDLRE
jgi:hypothetical protein